MVSGPARCCPARSGVRHLPGHRLPLSERGHRGAAARAPDLVQAREKAKAAGWAYLVLAGKVVAGDRCAEKTTSVKGEEIDRWYSGKAHRFGGNIQALFSPGGVPLWTSPASPGGVHDITAAREHVLPTLRPYLADLPVPADAGYEGAGHGVHVPVKKPANGHELDIDTRTGNALLRSLRCRGERGFTLLSGRGSIWYVSGHVTASQPLTR